MTPFVFTWFGYSRGFLTPLQLPSMTRRASAVNSIQPWRYFTDLRTFPADFKPCLTNIFTEWLTLLPSGSPIRADGCPELEHAKRHMA